MKYSIEKQIVRQIEKQKKYYAENADKFRKLEELNSMLKSRHQNIKNRAVFESKSSSAPIKEKLNISKYKGHGSIFPKISNKLSKFKPDVSKFRIFNSYQVLM